MDLLLARYAEIWDMHRYENFFSFVVHDDIMSMEWRSFFAVDLAGWQMQTFAAFMRGWIMDGYI